MATLPLAVGVFVVSLAVLLGASELFVSAMERISLALGVSPFLVGATVVAGGTTLPELVSSILAAVSGAPEFVLGTAVGSSVANVFLILGLAAVAAGHLRINRELMKVDLPLLMASAVFLLVVSWDASIAWYEGLIGLGGLATYIHFTLSTRERLDEVVEELVDEHTEVDSADRTTGERPRMEGATAVGVRTYATVAVSLVVLFVAADQFVGSILTIAGILEIGTELVAITAVAVGTSLPEIGVSVTAVKRGSAEIAVGNILGANLFNTFAVVGVPSLVVPLSVPTNVRTYALPVMVLATLLYFFITQDREITRWEGVTLLLLYAAFVLNLPV